MEIKLNKRIFLVASVILIILIIICSFLTLNSLGFLKFNFNSANNTNTSSNVSAMPTALPIAKNDEDRVNGFKVGHLPLDVKEGDELKIVLKDFKPNSMVKFRFQSDSKVFNVNNDGNVEINYTLPAARPGLQVIEVTGDSASQSMIGKLIRLNYSGNPKVGDSYSFYICCFTPASAEETGYEAKLDYLGEEYINIVNEEGGADFDLFITSQTESKFSIKVRNTKDDKIITKEITVAK